MNPVIIGAVVGALAECPKNTERDRAIALLVFLAWWFGMTALIVGFVALLAWLGV